MADFDWGRFAESLEKAGGEFAGRLQYQWQQNQEEERVMREYGAKLELEDAQKIREEGRRLQQEKELAAHGKELDVQRTMETEQYKQTLEKNFNNPEFMNTVQTYLKSDNPEVKQLGEGVMSRVAALREGNKLSDEDEAFLSRALPGNSFAPISELVRLNTDRERDYQEQKARIGQYQGLADLYKYKEKDAFDASDVANIIGRIETFSQDASVIETNPMYIQLMEKYAQGKELNPGEQGLFVAYQKRLQMLYNGQSALYGLLRQAEKGRKEVPGEDKFIGPPEPTEIPEEPTGEAKKGPTGKELAAFMGGESAVTEKGPAAKAIQGFFGSMLEKGKPMSKKKQEPKGTTAWVRQNYNVPKGARIFTAKSVADLKKLTGVKKNPPKSGDLVWTGEELHEIKVENGKIAISKEAWNK